MPTRKIRDLAPGAPARAPVPAPLVEGSVTYEAEAWDLARRATDVLEDPMYRGEGWVQIDCWDKEEARAVRQRITLELQHRVKTTWLEFGA